MSNKTKKLSRRQSIEILFVFSVITIATFLVSIIVVSAISYIIVRTGVFNIVDKDMPGAGRLIMFIALLSVFMNLIFAIVAGKFCLRPVNMLIANMNRLASGDYRARMDIRSPFNCLSVLRTLSKSFNTMAEELQHTELLSSDFINNFSHEFKTPIVSIAGFAKLLKKGKLSEQQQKEYIDIIEEESLRLSYMATNVLDLTRIENQMILTDVKRYNLSEQIRACVLLFEEQWSKKNIEMFIDFSEYMISANEGLLKQVWINLIDNAIKFTPEYGAIAIKISRSAGMLSIAVSNSGEQIPEEARSKIFNKFYQADESHSSEGNGIGLAIVKKVVELHNGKLKVDSKKELTTFTVELPYAPA